MPRKKLNKKTTLQNLFHKNHSKIYNVTPINKQKTNFYIKPCKWIKQNCCFFAWSFVCKTYFSKTTSVC